MKKGLLLKITSLTLGIVMALGVGAVASQMDSTTEVRAADTQTETYTKVTSAPTDWSGKYLIVYEAGNVAFDGSRTTLDATSNTTDVTISNGSISLEPGYSFTIAKSGSNYTIKSASEYYIGQTSNANGLKSSTSTSYSHTISFNASDKSVNFVSGGAYLRYNSASDQLRFRYYKSSSYTSQKAICLYKLEASQPAQPEEKQLTVTNEIPATMNIDETFTPEVSVVGGTTVTGYTLTANPSNVVLISDGDIIAKEAGTTTITVSKTGDSSTTYLPYEFQLTVVENSSSGGDEGGDSGEGGSQVNGFVLTDLAKIKSTDVVVIASQKSDGTIYAMSNDNGTDSGPTAVSVTTSTVSNKTLIDGVVEDKIKWNITNNDGLLTIYPNGDTSKWLYCTNTNNGVRVGTNTNDTFLVDSGYLKHVGTSRYLGVYNSQDWRCYTNTTGNIANQTLQFYVKPNEGGGETPDPVETLLSISWKNRFDGTAPVAIEGSTITKESLGGTITPKYESGDGDPIELNSIEHIYLVSGSDKVEVFTTEDAYIVNKEHDGWYFALAIGEVITSNSMGSKLTVVDRLNVIGDQKEVTISFESKTQRVSQNKNQQVWENEDVVFTNNKASSQSDVADYAPIRLYAGSSITIEAESITKIVATATSDGYATALKNSAGNVATVSGSIVTITLDGTSNTYTIAKLTDQVRLNSLTVYSGENFANVNVNAQKIVVDFANYLHAQLDVEGVCKPNEYNLSSEEFKAAWTSISAKYAELFSGEQSEDVVFAKNMISNATAVKDGDPLQHALYRYEKIVSEGAGIAHITAFMSDTRQPARNNFLGISNNETSVMLIVVMSSISLLSFACFFFLRKRKEQQ